MISLGVEPITVSFFDQPKALGINPFVTVLVPTMNEELTISTFIDWTKEGFRKSGVVGEILIVDSSSDDTPNIAYAKGARVLRVPKRGLGDAYKRAVPYVRGEFVILGDADCTYDFREIGRFIDEFERGCDFIMGTRFAGEIETGSMPFLHRYFGTPLTTWLIRVLHRLPFSDVHCGMRALSKDLLMKLPFDEPGWEYAPEMVIRASEHANMITEVPIRFLKEPEGRQSHFRRGRFPLLEPMRAGLGSIRVTLIHSLDRVLYALGMLFFIASSLMLSALAISPLSLYSLKLSSNSSLILFSIGLVGYFFLFLGSMLNRLHGRKRFISKYSGKLLNFNFISLIVALYIPGFIFYIAAMYGACQQYETCEGGFSLFNGRALVLLSFGLVVLVLTWVGAIVRSFMNYEALSSSVRKKKEIKK